MQQNWEIIGIVVAVLMVVIGLRLILKKPKVTAPIEQHELTVDPETQQPIVPRHLRPKIDVPVAESHVSAQEHVKNQAVTIPKASEPALDITAQKEQSEPKAVISEPSTSESAAQDTGVVLQTVQTAPSAQHDKVSIDPATDHSVLETESELSAKTSKDLATDEEVKENETSEKIAVNAIAQENPVTESDLLDAHLNQQNRTDEDSALATAEQLVALYMYPNPERALSGERTLKMLLKYGLRFGEMSCFHRYENTEQPSALMFSVLRINDDGAPTGFDLETLSSEEVKGLAFFLALPNPQAVQGYDMMVSTAGLMARDTEGMVFDEQSLELTPQLREHWRHFVIEYKPGMHIE